MGKKPPECNHYKGIQLFVESLEGMSFATLCMAGYEPLLRTMHNFIQRLPVTPEDAVIHGHLLYVLEQYIEEVCIAQAEIDAELKDCDPPSWWFEPQDDEPTPYEEELLIDTQQFKPVAPLPEYLQRDELPF